MDDNIKQSWNRVAVDWVVKCEREINTWAGLDKFKLAKLTTDWSLSRRSSRGGMYAAGPGINLAMATLVEPKNSVYRVYEYPSFDSDPEIGGFYTDKNTHRLAMLVCHEMAHAVQFYSAKYLNMPIDRPHGDTFKRPYRKLRVKLLNPEIPNLKDTGVINGL